MSNNEKNNFIKWIPDKRTNYLHVCHRCGATTPNDVKFRCSNCNRYVEQEERYCPSCGGKYNWMEDDE